MPSTKNIAGAALLVGTLDICAAFLQVYLRTGKAPFKPVLLFVASGLLGPTAFEHGEGMMLVGLLVHYCIATAFTLFFFFTIAKTAFAKHQRLLTGILYGAFTWMVMNLLVLPLTGAKKLPQDASRAAVGMGILILCIGLPLAFLANRQKRPNTQVAGADNLISSGSTR